MSSITERLNALGSTNGLSDDKPTIGHLASMYETEMKIREKACQKIQFSQPLLYLRVQGIIYPNSIVVIQGQKGVHKSRLTENLCAAFLTTNKIMEFIGFKADPLKHYHIVYIDTERNINDQYPYAVQRIKVAAGLESSSNPDNLNTVSLIEIKREDRFEAISQYLEDIRRINEGKQIIVVLDVITDCIGSFNDPKESMKLLDHINKVINRYDITFICVIHENPNSFGEGKARGHLGTELINKATTVISIGYEKGSNGNFTDLIAMKFLHTRNSKRPEPHYLKYSEKAKGLVVADPSFIQQQKELKAGKAQLGEFKDWLRENLKGEQAKAELTEKLTVYFGCSTKTIDTRLKELAKGDEPFLSFSKKGKEVFYSLYVPF